MRFPLVLALASCGDPEESAPPCDAVFYLDGDRDAFGDPEKPSVGACVRPAGYAAVAGDCDDTRFGARPGADELCNGADDDCDGSIDEGAIDPSTWFLDTDGDGYGADEHTTEECVAPAGYAPEGRDCDETDPAIHPGADEICDAGIDNDCNDLADEADPGLQDFETWYVDGDHDGFGEPLAPISACDPPPSSVLDNTDCNDVAAEAHPGAQEICDGIDDDCDELVDEDDKDVIGLSEFWPDGDGDGWGTGAEVIQCFAPSGYADTRGDCDDGDAAIGGPTSYYVDVDGDGYGAYFSGDTCGAIPPGNALVGGDCDDADAFTFPEAYELCDGIDNDCNATVDDAIDYVDWYVDVDGDGYGDASDAVNDCARPSGYALRSDDCDDISAAVHPEAGEICSNGIDDDCDLALDNCPVDLDSADLIVQGGESEAFLGAAIAAGDLDADGTSDLVVGAPSAADGSVIIVPGPATGTLDANTATKISTTAWEKLLGWDVATGDVDGDTANDLLVGTAGVALQSSFLFLGPITAGRSDADADAVLDGVSWGSFVEIARDVDGDGGRDLVFGTIETDGSVYVASGATSGTIDLTRDATYTYVGSPSDWLGAAGVDIGDATGDGIAELALSAVGASDGGVVYLLEGGLVSGSYDVDTDPLATITGDYRSWFGAALSSADYDTDGTADLVVGAPLTLDAASEVGAVHAFLGPFDGDLDAGDALARWESNVPDGLLGIAVAMDGDVDGDKSPDVLMGALGARLGTAGDGCAYLQLGLASGSIDVASLRSFPGDDADSTGSEVRFVPDWDGDDGSEIAIGSPNLDTASEDVGAVHVFFSTSLLPY